jgi:hypothetical protein
VRDAAYLGILVSMALFVPALFVGLWALDAGRRRVVSIADVVINISGGTGIASALLLLWTAWL